MQKEGGVPKRRFSKILSGDNPEENLGRSKRDCSHHKVGKGQGRKGLSREV